jgi:hypothetical protein
MKDTTNETVSRVVNRLKDIARKNGDKFTFSVDIVADRSILVYEFYCKEVEDGCEFVNGFGKTLQQAVENAEKGIKEKCDYWGYKE